MTDSKELEEYIKSMIRSLKNSIDDSGFDIEYPVILDLAIINSRSASGGFKIFVAKGSGKYPGGELSRLKIKLKKHSFKE